VNKKIKIAFIFGTRPETIKMYPVIRETKKYPNLIEPIVILTGQHREMMDQMTQLLKIKHDIDLAIMQHGQSLPQINSKSLLKLDEALQIKKPDLVLVQGDTTTTFSGALAAFYQKIKVGHIEAGLRTSKKYYPYPEEMNRRLTTVLADYHFTPTINAANSLHKEGINPENIFNTGNTVIDSLLLMQNKFYRFSDDRLNKALKTKKQVLLVTMHRRENWGESLENLCQSLLEINQKRDNLLIIFPVHKNPIIRDVVFEKLKGQDNIILLEPLDYCEMANLIAFSTLVLTDSGGIQEEAPALGKPVLILRSETERPEVVDIGAAKLVGTATEIITQEVDKLLSNSQEYQKMIIKKSPYGDGYASKRIIEFILYRYGLINDPPVEFVFDSFRQP